MAQILELWQYELLFQKLCAMNRCFQHFTRSCLFFFPILLTLLSSGCHSSNESPTPKYSVEQHGKKVTLRTATGARLHLPTEAAQKTKTQGNETMYRKVLGDSDMRIYRRNGLTAYDLILPPGGDPDDLILPLEPHQQAQVQPNGDVLIQDQGGFWKHSAPIAYQDLPGGRKAVTCRFEVREQNIGFHLGKYDPNYELIIDPTIQWLEAQLMVACSGAADELGGRIYHDIDNNGTFAAGSENGIPNAIIRLYDCSGNGPIATTNSDINGQYTFTGLTPDTTYRIEIQAPDGSNYLPAFAGAENQTTVQFSQPGSCSADVGFLLALDFCEEELRMVLPCFENGSGVGNSSTVLVSFDYGATGEAPPPQVDFSAAELGSIFGTAFTQSRSLVFTSAFLKRHSGLGPRGLDGIYAIDYAGHTPRLVGGLDLQGVMPGNGGAAIDLGSITRNAVMGSISGPFDLPADRLESSIDLDAFAKVGTVGYGDIDLAEDGRYLWAVNLHQRALIRLDLNHIDPVETSPNLPPSSAVRQYPLEGAEGLPDCTDGVLRPFGLTFRSGRGYIGCVCDASEATPTIRPAELTGHILSFDTASALSFTEEVSFSFDYDREPAYLNGGDQLNGEWHRWIDTFTDVTSVLPDFSFVSAPQPIISDLEILDNGDMAIAVMDRFAHQAATENLTAQVNSDSLVSAISAGDLLYAQRDMSGHYSLGNSSWTDPGVPSPVPAMYPGFLDDDGPNGTGESFWGDYYVIELAMSDEGHYETATGGLAYQPGSGELAATVFDPLSFFSQGMRYFDLTTGGFTRNYRVLETDFASPAGGGKASSLGDPELICGVPPLQLGNYAWIDSDSDGIQDPCEEPLPDLLVRLFDETGTLLATTQTNGDGTYYFTEPGTPGETWTNAAEGIDRYTTYFIAFGDSSVLEVNGDFYELASPDVGTGPQPDINDSDAVLGSVSASPESNLPGASVPSALVDIPVITITTGGRGGADHTLDAGFIGVSPPEMVSCVPLACPDQLNLTVNADCTFPLTPQLILNELQVPADEYEIRILNDQGQPIPTDTLIYVHVGRTVTYMIYRFGCEQFPCWGKLMVEDKSPPILDSLVNRFDTLECPLRNVVLNNPATVHPDSARYLGRAFFSDNCAEVCATTTRFVDTYESYPCDSLPLTGKITRRWTATDCNGHESTAMQYFYLKRPELDDLTKGNNQVIQTCTPKLSDVPETAGPYWLDVFGDTLYLQDLECGGYNLNIDEKNIPVCQENGSFKLHRFYKVLDWCTNTSIPVDTLTIEVGDFAGPEFSGNAFTIPVNQPTLTVLQGIVDRDSLLRLHRQGHIPAIPTGPSDCTGAFSTVQGQLFKRFGFDIVDCSTVEFDFSVFTFAPDRNSTFPGRDSIWQQANYRQQGQIISNLPVGVYALVINATDACRKRGRGVIFFTIKDLVSPTMKCDDEVHVTLTNGNQLANGGYARVYPRSLEENSWDNCQMDRMEVRRLIPEDCIDDFIQYGYDVNEDGLLNEDDGLSFKNGQLFTTWDTYIELFCCDLGSPVTVEVRGYDQARDPLTGMEMANTSVCWLDVVAEDKVDPRILAPADLTLDCTDPRIHNLSDMGSAELITDHCGNMLIEELDPVFELDDCHVGTITRRFQAVKNPGTPNEERSLVVEQVITVVEKNHYSICFPADVRLTCGNDPVIPGVTYEESSCDLIAVSSEDRTYTATQDPEACYKIFRTYQVINWCEYDKESEPVYVGRDWDDWNGTNPGGCTTPEPDGDGAPGEEGICVIVRKDFGDFAPDTVYYDRDANPYNTVPDNPESDTTEGYWWRVVSGDFDPQQEAYYEGNCSSWSIDSDQTDSDISGNLQGDEAAHRYGSFGYWVYTQHIIVYDNNKPEATLTGPDIFCADSGSDCAGTISYTLNVTDDCTGLEDVDVSVLLDLNNTGIIDQNITSALDGNQFSGRFPIGEHRLEFRINDGCGNVTVLVQVFEIEDCKAPTPSCIGTTSITLMPTQDARMGALPVFAEQFVVGEVYDCSGQGPQRSDGLLEVTEFYVARDLTLNASDLDTAQLDDFVVLTCEDLGELIPLEIHAMDTAGNHNFCIANVFVGDNQGFCSEEEASGAVSGGIATYDQELVENVEVRLSGGESMTYQTDASGNFQFAGLREGYDYTVIPRNDSEPKNGVSTFDLVLIQKHILGAQPLSNPYQLIAADINASGSISTLDLIQLRKMVLNIDHTFKSNSSWRFVDADYRFPDPRNPWAEPWPEVKNINDLEGELVSDFIGIKIGDINGNARANSASATQPRSDETPFLVHVDDLELRTGEHARIPVKVKDNRQVPGFQFTLQLEGLALRDLESGIMEQGQLAWFEDSRELTASFVNQPAISLDQEVLFYLHVTAQRAIQVKEAIRISPRRTLPEAYTDDGLSIPLLLQYGDNLSTWENQLLPNEPNPWHSETIIPFVLAQKGNYQLDIFDARGRRIRSIRGEGITGRNEVRLRADQVSGSGLYYYRLQANGFQGSRSMVLRQ